MHDHIVSLNDNTKMNLKKKEHGDPCDIYTCRIPSLCGKTSWKLRFH